MAYDARSWFTSANLTIPRGNEKGSSRQLANIPQDRFSLTLGMRPDPKWEFGLRSTVASERKVSGDDSSSDTLILLDIDNITNKKYKIYSNILLGHGTFFKLNTKFIF